MGKLLFGKSAKKILDYSSGLVFTKVRKTWNSTVLECMMRDMLIFFFRKTIRIQANDFEVLADFREMLQIDTNPGFFSQEV